LGGNIQCNSPKRGRFLKKKLGRDVSWGRVPKLKNLGIRHQHKKGGLNEDKTLVGG